MAYIIEGSCPLIFCANPRTGSASIANAFMEMGAERDGEHHDPPSHVSDDAIVFQTVRLHFDVLNSLWWKGRPYGNFEQFVFAACAGQYQHVHIPMYGRFDAPLFIRYNMLQRGFFDVCGRAGVEPVPLKRTPSRTMRPTKEMFSAYLRQPVIETFGEEMKRWALL